MGNGLKVSGQPNGSAANSLLSQAPVSAGSAQQLRNPHDFLGLANRSEQPESGLQPQSLHQANAAAQKAGDRFEIDGDDDVEQLLGPQPANRDPASRAPASAMGPYQESDCLEFRKRHYKSAQDVVGSLVGSFKPKEEVTRNETALQALEAIQTDLDKALQEFDYTNGDRARSTLSNFNDMATLVGGKNSPTKWGWVRCLFSSNARRARTIQQQAENGLSFKDIYRENKVANIHPKAALALFIRGRLKAAGLGDHEWASTAKISKQLGQRYVALTEKSEAWRTHTYEHDFKSIDGNTSLAMTSRLIPAAEIPQLASGYTDGQRGVSSMNSKDTTHPANFWMTEFKPAQNSEAELSFKGFRHGVLDAYGLNDSQGRKEANKAKVAELVRAAGSEMPSACKRQDDGSWLIPMVSVSLQTHGSKETDMIEGQKAAWAAIAKPENSIEMPGPAPDGSPGSWKLRPQPVTFSVGVNIGAMFFLSSHWNTARPDNDAAIETLLKTARASRDMLSFGNPQEAIRKKAITELIGQIEAMRDDKSYQSEGQNPYKFAARILVLAQLSGSIPCFNCKSGKDRTGMVDVEVKSLLQSINENIQRSGADALSASAVANEPDAPSIVPSYNDGRTSEEKAVFKDLHLNGGSQQVSLATTGLMGNKTNSNYLKNALNRDHAALQLIAGFARNADGNK